jgi:non-canonical purine NTP pyrophosphatase (RdgB/HAM1 family)
MLYFVTGNPGKLAEIKSLLPEVEQLDIDLMEIQDIDARNIIREKLTEARRHQKGELLVEDTSLYLDCLNGFPGPLIKWLLGSIGDVGIFELAQRMGNDGAQAKTIIGHVDEHGTVSFFEGVLRGRIVKPHGDQGFGWDRIFQPEGTERTFAAMSATEKNSISMRRRALQAFLEWFRTRPATTRAT